MRDERTASRQVQDDLFAIIDDLRTEFSDVLPEEIERNAVAIVRQLREEEDAAIGAEGHAAVESPSQSCVSIGDR